MSYLIPDPVFIT